ncbi:hypothetical protein RhiirA5_465898 [Rhizophagus irregularis]|uniref:Uncharacterized protein n=1 Tax=Rhizophagus irregularis TaxID=588596 RepID=A0A2I1DWY7_9GLOM|nr:hypothetical protein RhiirA5_465898 [Rhizophagus irregularis]PKY14398.1 hypothetical protein RhiirB3_505356 [Rhizophagus irregularis]CAB5163953.1 unnamed protein product [Rhizophagus irregularis]CAB5394054.1 unnamed protein product [Rhizophagus irregularis]
MVAKIKNLRFLGKFATHHAIKVNTEKGGQYLIERTSDKDPKDPKSTVIFELFKDGKWKLKEFHNCKDGTITLEQDKKDEFYKKAYNLLTVNCQQATKKSISQILLIPIKMIQIQKYGRPPKLKHRPPELEHRLLKLKHRLPKLERQHPKLEH